MTSTSLSCNSWSRVYRTRSRPSKRKSPVYIDVEIQINQHLQYLAL